MKEPKDEELTLPRSTVRRIIKTQNKMNKMINETVKGFIMQCALEFIHLLSLEASEVCANENKKTINCDHVLAALDNLGFYGFKEECEKFYKFSVSKNKRKNIKIDKFKESGLTKEEYEKQQLELFAKAKLEYQQEEDEQKPDTLE